MTADEQAKLLSDADAWICDLSKIYDASLSEIADTLAALVALVREKDKQVAAAVKALS